AILSKDPDMVATVNSVKDLHSENTKKVYGIDYEDIKARLQLAKTSGNDQDVVHYQMLWDDFYAKRKFIKALSFAITYGAGSGKIAKDLRITVPEAEKLINDFYTAYPKAKEWQDRTFLHAIRDGYVETPFGRKRETPLIKGRTDAYKALVQNDIRTIKDLKRNGEYWTLRDEQKQCKNTPIQSIATDMCSLAAVKVNRAFKKSGLRAKLYFWVHDSIVFHCHIDDVVPATKLVADIMENQVKYEGDPVNYRVEAEVGFTYEYVAKLERKDIMSDNFTKELVLERLDKSLDDDINKRFNLIVKSTSTVMNDLPTYIAAMKEAKGDYFNEMVEKLGLGVNTPDEFMAHLNQTTLTEYLEATDISETGEDDDEPE
ncbi:MAG: hypothetical protein JHC33_01830, partial [Ignisphaera sp.]|nr:hypothetical protein [Ignisphaera sp.]